MTHYVKIQSFNSRKRRVATTFHKERGVVAIVVALSIVVLVGFLGLALDLGKLFVTKTELQNSADACALSAARELTGANANQLVLAETAGIAAGTLNNVMFQKQAVIINVNEDVTFSETLNGGYVTKGGVTEALEIRFVRCTVERINIRNWFMQVLGIGDQDVRAAAVASLVPGQTTCAIPAGICTADVEVAVPGDWIAGAVGPEGELSGGFKWVDFTPPGGGAPELEAFLTGDNCELPAVGSIVGEGGVKASLAQGWNTRFGVYHNSFKDPLPIPDMSGFAYTDAVLSWPSKFNAFDDFKENQRPGNKPYQGDALTELNIETGGYTVSGTDYLEPNGRDRRLTTVAVIDCEELDEGGPTTTVDEWACVFMLHPINSSLGGSGTGADRMFVEYLGLSSDSASPCATSGSVGGADSIGPLVPALVQ